MRTATLALTGRRTDGVRVVRASEFIFALAAVAATHLAFEVALYAALPRQFSVPHLRVSAHGFQTWQPGAHFDYQNLPGVVPSSARIDINDDGLRDDAVVRPKQADERRVIVVGDSNTAAMQLPREQIFTTCLGALLAARARDRSADGVAGQVRVVNAGVKASGLAEHLLWLRYRGFALEPDLIVVQIAADDPDDDLAHGGFTLSGGAAVEAARLARPAWWRAPALTVRDAVCNHSLVYYRLWSELRSALTAPASVDTDAAWWMRGRPSGAASGNSASMPGSLLDVAAAPPASVAAKPDPGVALSAALLGEIIEEATARGVGVLVLPLPHPLFLEQGHPRLEAVVSRGVAAPTSVVRVDDWLRSANRAGHDPYLAHDGHLNETGHRLVAEALLPAIESALAALPAARN